MDGLKTKFHLRHNATKVECARNADEVLTCATEAAFRAAIVNGRACGTCEAALEISDSKVRKAYSAYIDRLSSGANDEEAIRNTRQEFDLNEREETKLLSDLKADRIIEALS